MSNKKEKSPRNADNVKIIPSEDPAEISNESLEDLAKEAVKKFKSLS